MARKVTQTQRRLPPLEAAVGQVLIRCSSPATTLLLKLSDERPNVSAGYGGWEEIARPRRVALPSWTGSPLRRLTLPLLIDNYQAGGSIELDIARLERLARPRPGGSPPSIIIDAPGGAVPLQGLSWVVDGLEWGDALMNASGNRTRQYVVLSLLEWLSDELVQEQSPASRRQGKSAAKSGKNKKKGARNKRHAAKKGKQSRAAHHLSSVTVEMDGEDLATIAARELGDASRWTEIAQLNGLRDPRAISTGQVLRLP